MESIVFEVGGWRKDAGRRKGRDGRFGVERGFGGER